jgi:hypothetical protein
MNENPDPDPIEPEPDLFWIAAVLPVIALLTVIASGVAFFAGHFNAGLCGLAVAAIFFALARILDSQEEILRRLKKLENKLKK